MPNGYDINTAVRFNAQIKNRSTKALVDPSTLTFATTDPSGNVDTYTYGVGSVITKSSTGVYYADITPDEGGRWKRVWTASGTVIASDIDYFLVRST